MPLRLQLILGYLLLTGLVALVCWGFVEAVQAEPAIVGSIGVAAAGAFGVVWQQRQSEEARIREAHRDRMKPIYYDLLGTVFKKIGDGSKSGGSDAKAEDFFRDLKARQLTLGASSEMVQAFNAWGKEAAEARRRRAISTRSSHGKCFSEQYAKIWATTTLISRSSNSSGYSSPTSTRALVGLAPKHQGGAEERRRR